MSWRYGALSSTRTCPPRVDAQENLKGKYPPDLIAEMNGRLARIAHDEACPCAT